MIGCYVITTADSIKAFQAIIFCFQTPDSRCWSFLDTTDCLLDSSFQKINQFVPWRYITSHIRKGTFQRSVEPELGKTMNVDLWFWISSCCFWWQSPTHFLLNCAWILKKTQFWLYFLVSYLYCLLCTLWQVITYLKLNRSISWTLGRGKRQKYTLTAEISFLNKKVTLLLISPMTFVNAI